RLQAQDQNGSLCEMKGAPVTAVLALSLCCPSHAGASRLGEMAALKRSGAKHGQAHPSACMHTHTHTHTQERETHTHITHTHKRETHTHTQERERHTHTHTHKLSQHTPHHTLSHYSVFSSVRHV